MQIFFKIGQDGGALRIEQSKNSSGIIINERSIPLLKHNNYIAKNYKLDGDAPKQFIKAYFPGDQACIRKNKNSSWCAYIAKTAEKWYPVESVTEYLINRIGQVLKLKMNEVRLVRANTQIRFLSRYFVAKNERLVHGAEICGAYLEDKDLAEEIANDKRTARQLFTFQFVKAAIEKVYPQHCQHLLVSLVEMLVFDALVGNDDRHFYNWGIIDSSKKSKKAPKFAPLYDSARGLLWNWDDANIERQLKHHSAGGKKIVQYIEGAAPRISIEGDSDINHFALMTFLKGFDGAYGDIIERLSANYQEELVLKLVKKEFAPLIKRERFEAITLILRNRFEKIRRL